MKAKAAVFMGANNPFEIREYELIPPKPGYAKMSLIASVVCGRFRVSFSCFSSLILILIVHSIRIIIL